MKPKRFLKVLKDDHTAWISNKPWPPIGVKTKRIRKGLVWCKRGYHLCTIGNVWRWTPASSSTLPGFRSRWITPRLWTWAIARGRGGWRATSATASPSRRWVLRRYSPTPTPDKFTPEPGVSVFLVETNSRKILRHNDKVLVSQAKILKRICSTEEYWADLEKWDEEFRKLGVEE